MPGVATQPLDVVVFFTKVEQDNDERHKILRQCGNPELLFSSGSHVTQLIQQ